MWDEWMDDKLGIYANMEKYAKIVYKTDPIGEYGIILYLTTFDIEAFENDKNLEKIPTKEVGYGISVNEFSEAVAKLGSFGMSINDVRDTQTWRDTHNPNMMLDYLEEKINRTIHDHYIQEYKKLRDHIECMRKIEVQPSYNKDVRGNVTNCGDVQCDVIRGNVVNCSHVEVREIRGNMVNCRVYKK